VRTPLDQVSSAPSLHPVSGFAKAGFELGLRLGARDQDGVAPVPTALSRFVVHTVADIVAALNNACKDLQSTVAVLRTDSGHARQPLSVVCQAHARAIPAHRGRRGACARSVPEHLWCEPRFALGRVLAVLAVCAPGGAEDSDGNGTDVLEQPPVAAHAQARH
jgi:hypothetical protein